MRLTMPGVLGVRDIYQIHGGKSVAGSGIHFVTSCLSAASGVVNWPVAIVVPCGATAGGYRASRLAQPVSQPVGRGAILSIGVVGGLWLLQ